MIRSHRALDSAMVVLTLTTPTPAGMATVVTASDVNARLAIPMHESDISIYATTMGFRLTIADGPNALAASDVVLFPGDGVDLRGHTWAEMATEIARAINALIAGGAVTCTWSGSSTGGSTGVFVITAPGATAITIAAPSSGTSLTIPLFGGTTDQDAVATTWTGAAPRDRGKTGVGWIGICLANAGAYTTGFPFLTFPLARCIDGSLPLGARMRRCKTFCYVGFQTAGQSSFAHVLLADTADGATASGRGCGAASATVGAWCLLSAGTVTDGNSSQTTSPKNVGTFSIIGTGANRKAHEIYVDGYSSSDVATSMGAGVAGHNVLALASDALYPMIIARRFGGSAVAELRCKFAYEIDTGVTLPS